jgi:hypothetical protein
MKNILIVGGSKGIGNAILLQQLEKKIEESPKGVNQLQKVIDNFVSTKKELEILNNEKSLKEEKKLYTMRENNIHMAEYLQNNLNINNTEINWVGLDGKINLLSEIAKELLELNDEISKEIEDVTKIIGNKNA